MRYEVCTPGGRREPEAAGFCPAQASACSPPAPSPSLVPSVCVCVCVCMCVFVSDGNGLLQRFHYRTTLYL